jgi:hypothetical protein
MAKTIWQALYLPRLEAKYGRPRGDGKDAADTRSKIMSDLNRSPARQGRSRNRKPRKTGRK